MNEASEPTTSEPSPRRRIRAGGVVAALALLGIGGAAVAQERGDHAPSTAMTAATTVPMAIPVEAENRSFEDPFAGMTNDQVDALSDEEFFALLDQADPGWDTEDTWTDAPDDANDPFAGMTNDQVDALSDEEFFALLDQADTDWDTEDTWTDTPEDPDDHTHDDHTDDEALEASFAVDGDQLDTSGVDAATATSAQAIWDRFVQLIPADQRTMLAGFELLGADAGGHVYTVDEDPTKWIMGIGNDLGDELDYVLIHEFAHLLTLQAKEVPPSFDSGDCPTYHTGEGCALSGSTFASFVAAFWPQQLLDEMHRVQESVDDAAMDAFYERYRDQFVTDYATTNPAEDLAETFTAFVLGERPTGTTIADLKVQFLWADPAMTALRDHIRAAL